MRIRACVGAILLSLALAAPVAGQGVEELASRGVAAGADAELIQTIRARADRSGVDREAAARLLAPAVAAAEAGLPSRLLLQKALEGLSKGVPPERIAGVLSDLRTSLGRAGELVDPWLDGPGVREALTPRAGGASDAARARLVESVGLALRGGASEAAVGELLGRIPGRLKAGQVSALRLGVGAEVLPELPVAERNPRMASELVLEALNAGFGAAELRELPAALEAAARRGRLPAETVARGAMVQMLDELPAATVLQNLFQGDFPGNAPFDLPPGLERLRELGKGKGPPPS